MYLLSQIKECSDEDLKMLEESIQNERTRRETTLSIDKVRIYRVDAMFSIFFVSNYRSGSKEMKGEAIDAVLNEIHDRPDNLKIKRIKSLSEMPKDWRDSIPWNIHSILSVETDMTARQILNYKKK